MPNALSNATMLDCGHYATPRGVATGYAVDPDGKKICYPCADARQIEDMRTADIFVAYVSPWNDPQTVTTWTGGRLGRITRSWNAGSINGYPITHYAIHDVHGREWYGKHCSDWKQSLVMRRRKSNA